MPITKTRDAAGRYRSAAFFMAKRWPWVRLPTASPPMADYIHVPPILEIKRAFVGIKPPPDGDPIAVLRTPQ